MNLICFSARRKCGKTLAAEYVCQIDSRFKKVSFADVLKDEYAKAKGIDRSILDNVLEKEKHRRAMQLWGDEQLAINPYVYVTALLDKLSPVGYYVIDDLRKLQELEVMIKLGAIPYGIFSETHKRAERGWVYDPAIDQHQSESDLGDLCSQTWHCLGGGLLYNNKTKEHFKDQVFGLVKKHFPFTMKDLELLSNKC